MPVAAERKVLGIAKDVAKGQLSTAVIATGTSLVLTGIVGTFTASGFVTVYDGSLTETKAVSAFTGGNTLTVAALTNPHPAGCLVTVTAAADAPSNFIPVGTFSPTDNITYIPDTNFRGSMVVNYGHVAGPISGGYATGGNVYCDTFGYWAGVMFGDVVTTGGSAPFSHAFAALNSGNGQPKSMTITDSDPVQARAYPGMLCTDLSISLDSSQALTYTASLIGFNSGTVGQPTASFSTLNLLPGWLGVATIGGTFTPTLLNATIDFKRSGTVDNTADGTQSPYTIFVGPLDVSGKFTIVYEDESQLLNYLNSVKPSIDFNFTRGAGAALEQFKFHASQVVYTVGAKAVSGDQLQVDITWEADSVSADAGASGGLSPGKLTLQNALAANTYQ
jgi:hypothetical protein